MVRRPFVVLLATITSLSFLMLGATDRAMAAPPMVPKVGERFLSDADRDAALAAMPAAEHAHMLQFLADDAAGLVVSHTRRGYEIEVDAKGRAVLEELGASPDPATSALSLPNLATAEGTKGAGRAGTQLWVTFTVIRTRNAAPFEWELYTYASWSGQQGANAFNGSPEIVATAWHGGLALHSQWGSGKQVADWPCNAANVVGNNTDGVLNAGTSWEFKEWNGVCLTRYFQTDVRIRANQWKNELSNALAKYYHTYSNDNYSVTIGAAPSITINRVDKTWPVVVWGSFTH